MSNLDITSLLAIAAASVVLVQQILKSKYIPTQIANKYPVPTNIVLSVIASGWVWYERFGVFPNNLEGWLGVVVLIAVSAALTYNQLLGKWDWLRSTEA